MPAWRLTNDPRAALIAGLLGAWYPFHAEHYSHLELHWVMFVPLAIVAALRMLAAPGWKTGLALRRRGRGAVAVIHVRRRDADVVPRPLRAACRTGVARPAVVAARSGGGRGGRDRRAVGVALGVPYMKSREARGERALFEVSDGSAQPIRLPRHPHPARRVTAGTRARATVPSASCSRAQPRWYSPPPASSRR